MDEPKGILNFSQFQLFWFQLQIDSIEFLMPLDKVGRNLLQKADDLYQPFEGMVK